MATSERFKKIELQAKLSELSRQIGVIAWDYALNVDDEVYGKLGAISLKVYTLAKSIEVQNA